MKLGLIPFALGVALCAHHTILAEEFDWLQWQGSDRTAHSKETGLLKEWPVENRLAALKSFPLLDMRDDATDLIESGPVPPKAVRDAKLEEEKGAEFQIFTSDCLVPGMEETAPWAYGFFPEQERGAAQESRQDRGSCWQIPAARAWLVHAFMHLSDNRS